MRTNIFALTALTVGVATSVLAQTGAPERPPTEPPSNVRTGVVIDRFIGDANDAPSTVTYDTMLSRRILTAGDPQAAGNPGAVLLYRKEIALNTLEPGESSSYGRSSDQMMFYVESGQARLDDGKSFWMLKPGVLVLAPPQVAHRFKTVGDETLTMISVQIPVEAGVAPRREMIVRDVDKLAFTERNGHWSNMAKYVLVGQEDGLHSSDRVYLVYMSPMTAAGPHAHAPGQEEVWIKVSDGKAMMQLGSEIRMWPQNAGFLAPPNGQTVHAAFNLDSHRQAWLYVARLHPEQGAAPLPPPATARPINPAIAQGLIESNVASTPLATADLRVPRR